MNNPKKIIKSISILFVIFTILSFITTQYLAYTFMYQSSLSGEIYHHIYQPFAWISWHNSFYPNFIDIYMDIYSQVLSLFFIFILIYFFAIFITKRKRYNKNSKLIKA